MGLPPTYAANLGRDRIIDALLALGATDLASAVECAVLQLELDTARRLHARLGAKASEGAREMMHSGHIEDDTLDEYHTVTLFSWAERCHFPMLVSRVAIRVVEKRGGGHY